MKETWLIGITKKAEVVNYDSKYQECCINRSQ